MTRWIAAMLAVVATGIGGAVLVPSADAQDSKPAREPAKISSPDGHKPVPTMPVPKVVPAPKAPDVRLDVPVPNAPAQRITEREAAERGLELTPAQREALRTARLDGREGFIELTELQVRPTTRSLVYQFAGHGQPGMWQIVTHKDTVILLNTASGDTFRLGDGKEGPEWKPIPRPRPDNPPAFPRLFEPRFIEPPRAPDALPRDPARPDRNAEEDARGARDADRPAEERKREDRLAEFENELDRVESKLREIERKLKDAGPDEREKLRNQRRELEAKLDTIEKELRDMRKAR